MSDTVSPFSAIIQKVEKGTSIPNGHRSFFFDEKSKTVLKKEPLFFQTIGKRIGVYAISADTIVRCNGFTYVFDNGISLKVSFTAKCSQHREEQLLKELYDPDKDFETMLNERLRSYLNHYFTEDNRGLSLRLLKNAEEKISKRCLSETGVLVTSTIAFQAEKNIKRFQLRSGSFPIRLQDYNEPVNIEYSLDVCPLEENLEKALLRAPAPENLGMEIREVVTQKLWKDVSINQLCLALIYANDDLEITAGKKSVKNILAESINSILTDEGRRIEHFELLCPSADTIKPADQLEVEHSYYYQIADESESVTVKSRVFLRLVDISAYKRAEAKYQIIKKSSNVVTWFKESVITPLVKDIMFDKKYKEILIHPDGIKEKIEGSISARAKEIGYTIKQQTHLPDIKKLKLVSGFTIALQDEEFETKTSNVKIKLNIIIKGKVTNLEKLEERLLHPTVDIESEMKSDILSTIESEIHTLDPERIYLYFSYTGDESDPVDKILSDSVKKCLREKYYVDPSLQSIVKLSQSEDEFIKKTKELRKELRKFDVTANPTGSFVESLVFEIQYRILGIDPSGWSTFLSRISKDVSIQFEELEHFLRALISERLNSIGYDTLKSERLEDKDILKEGVRRYAIREVAEKFGLLIDFYTFLKLRTDIDDFSTTTVMETFRGEIEHTRAKIKILQEKELQAIKNGNLESAADYKNQIEELHKSTGIMTEVMSSKKQIANGSAPLKKLFNNKPKEIKGKDEAGENGIVS